ncbi:hypothetical protein Aduo_002645 [Ancylostoma duodenale]
MVDAARQFDSFIGRFAQFPYDMETSPSKHGTVATPKSSKQMRKHWMSLHMPVCSSTNWTQHPTYMNYILPQVPWDAKFDKAMTTLKNLLGPQQYLAHATPS